MVKVSPGSGRPQVVIVDVVVEETLLFDLVSSGQPEPALRVVDARLDRRPSPLDARRRGSLVVAPV